MNQTVDEKILEQIRPYIVDKLDVEPADVTLDADFEKDLHADSLDRVEMFMKLEQECGFVIPNGDEAKIQTVGDVVKAMQEMGVEPETFQKKQDVKPAQKAASQKTSAMVLFFMTRGGKKLPRKTPQKPVAKLVMPQKPMMFNPGKKR